MIKKGSIVTIIFIVSLCIQLITQIIVTRLFGATASLDIFLAAVTIPTIMVTVIYATLNDIFLPLYAERRLKNHADADNFLYSSMLTLAITSVFLIWIASFFTEYIMLFLYDSRGIGFVHEATNQMNIMLYAIPCAIAATLMGTYFYARKQIVRFPIAQAVGSVVNLLLILWLQPLGGIWALVIAFILNIIFQVLLVIPIAAIRFRFVQIPLGTILLLWAPYIIGSFAIRSDAILIRSLGATLPTGYLVYLNLISKLFALAAGVMTTGLQVILLPHLVEYITTKEFKKAFAITTKAKIISLVVSIAVAGVIAFLAPYIVQLLFVGGKFRSFDAYLTIQLIPYFVLPAVGWGMVNVFFQPLIAIKKIIPLSVLQISSLVLAWIVGNATSSMTTPIMGIMIGLLVLLSTGIVGSELLWQYYKRRLS